MSHSVTFKGEAKNLLGNQVKPGDTAPDFQCLVGLDVVNLASTPAKPRLFSVVPSLDTGVCSMQTKKFDQELAQMKDKVAAYTVSLDLPFAQKRYCSAENIGHLSTLSDCHNHSFGKNYGVLLEGLPLPLLTRAVFVVDGKGAVVHAEYVGEVTNHPDYELALTALKKLL
ncbi:MAG: thiol peroxidase [Gemmataceae bacterium]|nr:thiol peroxidase [Gemmataceae bacterium]